MEIQQQLRSLGLHQTEIIIYLFLLKNGLSTPPIVSRETNIARTNCYNILLELKNKGLITQKIQAKKKLYQANDPDSLIDFLENKVLRAHEILPELKAIFTHQIIGPGIILFQGVEQIKDLYEQSLSTKTIFSIGSRVRLHELMPDFETYYFKEVQKRQIIFYDLTDQESKLIMAKMHSFLKGYYAVRQLPPEYAETATDILIWDDSVALLNFKDSVSAMILKNQPLSDMLQMLFKIIWKKLQY